MLIFGTNRATHYLLPPWKQCRRRRGIGKSQRLDTLIRSTRRSSPRKRVVSFSGTLRLPSGGDEQTKCSERHSNSLEQWRKRITERPRSHRKINCCKLDRGRDLPVCPSAVCLERRAEKHDCIKARSARAWCKRCEEHCRRWICTGQLKLYKWTTKEGYGRTP